MKFVKHLSHVVSFAATLAFAGCASDASMPRVIVPKASVNGHPARMFLDTGASSTVLFGSGAKRLGIKPAEISDPVAVTVDSQTFTAPLPIFRPQIQWYYRLAFSKGDSSLEGLIGWPEIRDNILVFDADQRMVGRVEQLPPETSGWTKLKIIPDSWLLLEIPLANGKTGTLEVDTGSPFGFEMPQRQWKQWSVAHPKAAVNSHWGGVASFGIGRYRTAWADEFKLGPVTLTDLPLQDMMSSQATFLQGKKPAAESVWAVGMYGLTRMDLIVDGKNGFAYVHPRPPPGPPYSGVKRPGFTNAVPGSHNEGGNWTFSDNVRLSSENLFVGSAQYKWGRNDLPGAIADYNRALEINPSNGETWSARAYLKVSLGDLTGSIADCTHALEIDPNNNDAWFRRGVARQIQGDYSGAVSDYEKVLALVPDDSDYPRLYYQTLLLRMGHPVEDSANTSIVWRGHWTKTISLFLAGRLGEKSFLAAAKKGDNEPQVGQKCEAFYYIGMKRLIKGDKAGAREAFQKSRSIVLTDYDEYQFAGGELARLNVVAQR